MQLRLYSQYNTMASIARDENLSVLPPVAVSRASRLERFITRGFDAAYQLEGDETSLYEVAGIELYVESEEFCGGEHTGNGRLTLTSKNVVWENVDGRERYSFPFKDVVLHAVCRDVASFPYKPCVYCQIDVTTREEASGDQYYSVEMRFAPTQSAEGQTPDGREASLDYLEPMFQAFSEGAKLNPDNGAGEGSTSPGNGGNAFEALASMLQMMNSGSVAPSEEALAFETEVEGDDDGAAAQRSEMLARFDEMLSTSGADVAENS